MCLIRYLNQGMSNAYFYLLAIIVYLVLAVSFACPCSLAIDMVAVLTVSAHWDYFRCPLRIIANGIVFTCADTWLSIEIF